jgi:hypothetical protein
MMEVFGAVVVVLLVVLMVRVRGRAEPRGLCEEDRVRNIGRYEGGQAGAFGQMRSALLCAAGPARRRTCRVAEAAGFSIMMIAAFIGWLAPAGRLTFCCSGRTGRGARTEQAGRC